MVASVKVIIKHEDGSIEWNNAKNLTEYQAKRLFRLCDGIINRSRYETFADYNEVVEAIDKIETGYYYEIYSISNDFVKKLELKSKKELRKE